MVLYKHKRGRERVMTQVSTYNYTASARYQPIHDRQIQKDEMLKQPYVV